MFLNGYKVIDGIFLSQFKQKANSENASETFRKDAKPDDDDDDYWWDLGTLDGLDLPTAGAGRGTIVFTNFHNPVSNQGWLNLNLSGSLFGAAGGGSSNLGEMPLFSCDNPTPRGCEEEELEQFLNQNVWESKDPYDKWNELKECEKDFFRNNPQHLYTARGNKAEAEKVAWERFGNCNTPNDRPMLNTIGDAYRHAYFAALNTHNMGHTKAKYLGDAHECDTPSNELDQKQMDLHNNAWGYHYGSTISTITESHFYTTFMNSFNSGQIKILQECN